MVEFRMPSLGADMEDGTLTEWRIKEGDMVKRGDIVAEVETQKGLIEIEIFEEGKVEKLLAKVGDKIKVGTVIASIDSSSLKQSENKSEKEDSVLNEEAQKIQPIVTESLHRNIKASPLAKRFAAEMNIDLSTIKGTGEEGAITKEDVEKAATGTKKTKEEKSVVPAEGIRRAVAAAMSKSNREIPHYYLEITIDMSKALTWLGQANKDRSVKNRLLHVVLLLKAVARSLREVPEMNATWENGLIRKENIHVGLVVSLRSGGLMVPAIHNTDQKTLDEIMQSLNDIIPRVRNQKLRSSELSDSTITVTSLGDGGADKVFGVIYPPQVAIVGFGGIIEQPFAQNGQVDVRPVLTATLAADHRATDGHTGSRFLAVLKKHLQKPEEL